MNDLGWIAAILGLLALALLAIELLGAAVHERD